MLLSRLHWFQRCSNITSISNSNSNSFIFKHINKNNLTYLQLKHNNKSCTYNTYRYIHYSNTKDNQLDRILKVFNDI